MKIPFVVCIALLLFGCNSSSKHPTERAEYAFLHAYADQALQDFHLKYLSPTVSTGAQIETFGARFMTRELHTLDQARTLIKTSSTRFVEAANKHPNLSKYFKDNTFNLNQLDYYISFWDENTDRPPKPYVALATVKDGKITYYFKRDDSEFLDDNATIVEPFNH